MGTPSDVSTSHQSSSVAISSHQSPSVAISRHQSPSEVRRRRLAAEGEGHGTRRETHRQRHTERPHDGANRRVYPDVHREESRPLARDEWG